MASYTQALTETLNLRGFIPSPFKQVATEGGYIVLRDEKTSLSSAISNLSNAMEKQSCPKGQTKIMLTYDEANSKYAFAAVVKR